MPEPNWMPYSVTKFFGSKPNETQAYTTMPAVVGGSKPGVEAQHAMGRTVVDSDLDGQWQVGGPQSRRPYVDRIAAGRQRSQTRAAGLVAQREEGGSDDQNVADHVVMDVAAEGHDAGRVEGQRRMQAAALIEGQLEGFGRRERIHVMTDCITVRKPDLGTCARDQDVREILAVLDAPDARALPGLRVTLIIDSPGAAR